MSYAVQYTDCAKHVAQSMYECTMCTRMPFWVPWIGNSMNYIWDKINFYKQQPYLTVQLFPPHSCHIQEYKNAA